MKEFENLNQKEVRVCAKLGYNIIKQEKLAQITGAKTCLNELKNQNKYGMKI